MQELDKQHSNETLGISIGDFRCSCEIKHKASTTSNEADNIRHQFEAGKGNLEDFAERDSLL